MGTTGGGLWKPQEIGLSWQNASDRCFNATTISAVAAAASSPHSLHAAMWKHRLPQRVTRAGPDRGFCKSTDSGETRLVRSLA